MLIDYLPSFLALTIVQILGVMSPGPDFTVVMRNSLMYDRRIGILTAIGVSLGTLLHISYILLGIGATIAKTQWLFHIFKYCGASYLIYIGIKGAMTKNTKEIFINNDKIDKKVISEFAALRVGFFTNAANPKAMIFFLSLFSAFITESKPNIVIFVYASIIFVTTIAWFIVVALCFSNNKLRSYFYSKKYIIERSTGWILIVLGTKILFSNSNF